MWQLQSNYAWTDAAALPPLDLGTTYFVEQAARRFVAPRVELTVVTPTGGSYATSSDPYGELLRLWNMPHNITPLTIVIYVPRREQHSGLLHPLMVHELGHAVEQQHDLVDDIFLIANNRARWLKRLQDIVAYETARTGATVQEAINGISYRLGKWIEEALCDSFATHLLGPTYLYAFLAEVVAGNMDHPGEKHPPPRQRVRLMLEQLDKLGWAQTMRSHAAGLDSWVRGAAAGAPDYQYSPLDGFLIRSLDTLGPHVRDRIRRHIRKPGVFTPDQRQLTAVFDLLARGIPPAQFTDRTAIPQAAIILGSWLYTLSQEGGTLEGVVDAPTSPVLETLLPKSLEMSALVAAWEQA